MSKRRKKSRSKSRCPEPLSTMIDLAGAVAMGLYANHRVKRDFRNGCGEESAKAAATVYGMGVMRRGSNGIINSGGLIGLSSALNSIEKRQIQNNSPRPGNITSFVSPVEPPSPAIKHPLKAGIWREYCEDGSEYGLDPNNFDSADDYEAALQEAKRQAANGGVVLVEPDEPVRTVNPCIVSDGRKCRWRKYCEDGTKYGIRPEDFETDDDYEDALKAAKDT